ncbi:MAG: hypothetical protein LBT21_05655 [Oscillospiraceae bacterium]|nr:hypothetical protein [Oscillospiraceae bacterium]
MSESPNGVANNSVAIKSADVTVIGPVRWFSPNGIGYNFVTETALQTYLRTAQASYTYGLTDRKTDEFAKLDRAAILMDICFTNGAITAMTCWQNAVTSTPGLSSLALILIREKKQSKLKLLPCNIPYAPANSQMMSLSAII